MPSDTDTDAPGAPTPDADPTIGHSADVHEAPTLGATSRPEAPATADDARELEEYELLEEIARGGMGVVYKARQRALNRVVALKMILAGSHASTSDVARFKREAESAAHLDHPGIVPVHEIGERNGLPFIAMGFVDGPSLADRLARGPLLPSEAVAIVSSVAAAVQYAHEHGVIHRDLKPANILLDRVGGPRVTDFGLAKRASVESGLTVTGQILGTPSYMPPEQAEGKSDLVGPAADIYALGAVLYAALVGRPPFQAASPMETLIQVVSREPVPPRHLNAAVDRDLETIVLKCLEKLPDRRYASAADLGADLKRYVHGEPIVARGSNVPYGVRVWLRNRLQTTFWVALVAAVSSAIMGYVVVSALVRALLDMIPGMYARYFPSVPQPPFLRISQAVLMPAPSGEFARFFLVAAVIVAMMLARGPIFAWLAKPLGRWDDLVVGFTAGLVSGAVFSGLLGPIFGVMLGHIWSQADLELMVDADRIARSRPAPHRIDPMILRYGDLRGAQPRQRASRVRYKVAADSVAGQLSGAALGLFAALILGPGLSLAEALFVGPLYRRRGRLLALIATYAELIAPLLGVVYSLLAIMLALVARGFREMQVDVTFLLLTAILSLGQLVVAIYLVRSRVHWFKRWTVYLITFGCLAGIALAAYD
jgi:tRNA A-37 threonylcarbamoyl transferase component Bud32